MENTLNIAGIGEVLWDFYDEQKFIGGAPANFALHVARAGYPSYLFSRVGDDELGRSLITALKKQGVNADAVQTDIFKPTATVKVKIDKNNQPHYLCSQNVAFDYFRFDSIWSKLASQMDAVFWDFIGQRNMESREAVRKLISTAEKSLKIFDINIKKWDDEIGRIVEDSLNWADVIKLNQNEYELIKSDFSQAQDEVDFLRLLIAKFNLKLAALTLGEFGCLLVDNHNHEFDPGYTIRPVDTSGAGDAFAAGLVIKILEKASLSETADYANQLAAFVSMHKGATPEWSPSQLDTVITKSLL